MQVRVYWNSQRRQWSVVNVDTRRVAFYADALTLTDVTYHAGLKGQHRVCKSGHKNRHKYIEGRLASFSSSSWRLHLKGLPAGETPVTYQPEYGDDEWHTSRIRDIVPVTHSRIAELTSWGEVYKEYV